MPRKRKRLPAEKRKPQILRSAINAIARSNYRTTSIADIAMEAGITEPAVYRYFPSKKVLFIELLEDVGRRMLAIWEKIVEQSDSPEEALQSISEDYYERVMVRRGELKVLFQAMAEVDDDEIRGALHDQFASYVKLLQGLIEECIDSQQIASDVDSEAAAWSWLSVGFTLNLVSLLRFDAEMDQSRLSTVYDLFLRSLFADPPLRPALADYVPGLEVPLHI